MRPSAPKRSLRLARLKKAHQTMSAIVKTNETIMPRPKPLIPGMRALIPNRDSHWSATAAMPGQTRRGFGDAMRLYTSAALKLFPVFSHKKAQKHKNKSSVNKVSSASFTFK